MEESIFFAQAGSTQSLIMWGGLAIVISAVYIETGLLLGLIVPGGETLLFSAGLLTATDHFNMHVLILGGLCTVAAIAGDNTGYYIGLKTGKNIYNWKENFIYKKKYLRKAEHFYHRKGKLAIILGRFLPVIRTFNPLLSGVTRLTWRSFFFYSLIGTAIYTFSLILLGYFIGQQFPKVGNYLEYVFLGVALVVIVPIIYQIIKDNRIKS